MRKSIVAATAIAAVLATAVAAFAGNGTPINTASANELTLAVYGDTPYTPGLLADRPRLVDSINSDPKVDLVAHLGDIHSGSMPCDTSFNETILGFFQSFKDPLVYSPGDNEWTDCHRLAAWLKLTVDPNGSQLFGLENVQP